MNTQEKDLNNTAEDQHTGTDSSRISEEQMAQGINIDENMAGTELPNDPLDDTDTSGGKELAEAKDKYLRLAAEFDNYKRRNAKERIELMQTAGRDVIQSLLDILDDSERAAKQLETTSDPAAIKEGVMLVFNKLKNTLQQKGLKVMDSKGEEFNADLHEAITEIPAPTPDLQGKIVDVVMPGYYLNDKLIRHAKVVVGK